MIGEKAGLICSCGSHEVFYFGVSELGLGYLFKCHQCGTFGFRGAFKSEDEKEDSEE